VEGSKFCLFLVVLPARRVSSISPRFHYRRHAFCFLPLAVILEFLPMSLAISLNLNADLSLLNLCPNLHFWVDFFFCSTGVWTHGFTLARQTLPIQPLHQPFYVLGIFQKVCGKLKSHKITLNFILISASKVAKITGGGSSPLL
jgi:hypothetical protein